jgi:hypothetical protein
MNDIGILGRILIVVGVALALLGGLIWLLSRANWFGRLPGDIRVERPGFTCLVPLASMIILSIVLTVVLNVVLRMMKK